MLPHLGAGAGTSIEDVLLLVRLLTRPETQNSNLTVRRPSLRLLYVRLYARCIHLTRLCLPFIRRCWKRTRPSAGRARSKCGTRATGQARSLTTTDRAAQRRRGSRRTCGACGTRCGGTTWTRSSLLLWPCFSEPRTFLSCDGYIQ